jgi:hypothetical protein
VSLDFKQTVSNTYILVIGFYDETYELLYGPDGKYQNFNAF